MKIVATVRLVYDEDSVVSYIAHLREGCPNCPDDPMLASPRDFVRLRVIEICEDELAVATMFGPEVEIEPGPVETVWSR